MTAPESEVPVTVIATFELELPFRMNVSKHKVKPLNMNIYRNLHFHSLNYQKKAFYDTVEPMLLKLPKMDHIHLEYEIYPKTKRLFDIVNVGSIVDKYFSDSLVSAGVIPDDNYEHLSKISFSFGGLSKAKEFVLVRIIQINKEVENIMRVFLDHEEITQAISDWVEKQSMPGASGAELIVEDGVVSAEVVFGDAPVKRKPGPKPGTKRKTKAKSDADTNDETSSSDDSTVDAGTGAEETGSGSEETEEGGNSKNPSEEPKEESSSEGSPKEVPSSSRPKKSIFNLKA